MKIRCPICRTLATWEENPNRPFCSERCRLMDLGKWAGGEYSIKGGDRDESHAGEAASRDPGQEAGSDG